MYIASTLRATDFLTVRNDYRDLSNRLALYAVSQLQWRHLERKNALKED